MSKMIHGYIPYPTPRLEVWLLRRNWKVAEQFNSLLETACGPTWFLSVEKFSRDAQNDDYFHWVITAPDFPRIYALRDLLKKTCVFRLKKPTRRPPEYHRRDKWRGDRHA